MAVDKPGSATVGVGIVRNMPSASDARGDDDAPDLEARVTHLETELPPLVHEAVERATAADSKAADALLLARHADRDTAEFRSELRDFRKATTASFNAVRADLAHLSQRLDAHDQRFDGVEQRLAAHDQRFDRIDSTLEAQARVQQSIVGMLTTLIDRDADS